MIGGITFVRTIYIEGFRQLRDEGFVREYGISTDSIDVLRKFYDISKGECAIVELDYSLLNTKPEDELLPFCLEKNLAVLVRGPLAMGMLSGRYDESSVFEDQVRSKWNVGEAERAKFEQNLERFKQVQPKVREDLVTAALRFVISHPVAPVAIP